MGVAIRLCTQPAGWDSLTRFGVGLVLLPRLPQVAATGFPLWNFPRSVALIDGLLVLILVGGVRFSVRLATRW